MSGEVFYGEIGDWREGPITIVTNKGVVEGVLSVVECSEVGTRLSQTLVEGVLFSPLFDVCRAVSIEVVAFSSYEDVQTTVTIESSYFVSLRDSGPGARPVIWPLEYKRSIGVENAVFQANQTTLRYRG